MSENIPTSIASEAGESFLGASSSFRALPVGCCPKCHTKGTRSLLCGRHCLECHWIKPHSKEESVRMGILKPHKKPEPNDGYSILPVLERYNLTLPKNAIEWRVAMKHGSHSVYVGAVTLLLTDGVLGWYLLGDETCFLGHLGNFTEDEEEKAPSEAQGPRLAKKIHTRNVTLANED